MPINVAQTEPDDPVIMIGGRPLLLVSVQGSSRRPDCVPVEIAWRRPPSGEPETYLIKPTDEWTDTSWDDGFLGRVGLTQQVAVWKGTPAALVARRCHKVFSGSSKARPSIGRRSLLPKGPPAILSAPAPASMIAWIR
jgi:hypothetical protein